MSAPELPPEHPDDSPNLTTYTCEARLAVQIAQQLAGRLAWIAPGRPECTSAVRLVALRSHPIRPRGVALIGPTPAHEFVRADAERCAHIRRQQKSLQMTRRVLPVSHQQ